MVDSLCRLKHLLFSIIWNVSITKHNFSLSSCCQLLTVSTIVWITVCAQYNSECEEKRHEGKKKGKDDDVFDNAEALFVAFVLINDPSN